MGPSTLKNILQKNFDLEIYLGVTHSMVLLLVLVVRWDPSVSVGLSSTCSLIDFPVVDDTPRSTPEYTVDNVLFWATPIPTPIELNRVACEQPIKELKHKTINVLRKNFICY